MEKSHSKRFGTNKRMNNNAKKILSSVPLRSRSNTNQDIGSLLNIVKRNIKDLIFPISIGIILLDISGLFFPSQFLSLQYAGNLKLLND